jgi:hypothetical protein
LKHPSTFLHTLFFGHCILPGQPFTSINYTNKFITHVLVLLVLLKVAVLITIFVVLLVIKIVFFGWRSVTMGVARVHIWVGVELGFFLPLHSTLGELLHHFNKLFAIVL